MVEFTHSLTPVLPALLGRVRALFDLNARPDLIAKHLRQGRAAGRGRQGEPRPAGARRLQRLRDGPARDPRPAGDGQSGHHHRLPVRRGVRRTDRHAVSGTASAHARTRPGRRGQRRRHRPPRHRRRPLQEHHRAGARRRDRAGSASTAARITIPTTAIKRLTELPGIGPWTAHYIAMRALRWPDAFPKEDIAVRNNLGGVTAKEAEVLSQAWRPWRSYAVMHVWGGIAGRSRPGPRQSGFSRLQ